jgi:formate hydrogenlyase subunit 3/multisubunit Na+/H+ antiporter MnhD subunit
MLGVLLLAAILILFFSRNTKLKRYIAFTVGGIALITLITIGLTMQTGTKSNPIQGSGKAIIENTVLTEQQQK